MSRFLKLSKTIVNLSHVSEISISEKKFVLFLTRADIDLFFLVGSGFLHTNHYVVNICAEKDANDYKIVSDWIDNLK